MRSSLLLRNAVHFAISLHTFIANHYVLRRHAENQDELPRRYPKSLKALLSIWRSLRPYHSVPLLLREASSRNLSFFCLHSYCEARLRRNLERRQATSILSLFLRFFTVAARLINEA